MDDKYCSYLEHLLPYSHHLYDIPNHSIGNDFVNGLSNIIDGIGPAQRKYNSEFLLLYIILVLYQVPNCSGAKSIKQRIKRQLDRFKDFSNHGVMVSEAESVFSKDNLSCGGPLMILNLQRPFIEWLSEEI